MRLDAGTLITGLLTGVGAIVFWSLTLGVVALFVPSVRDQVHVRFVGPVSLVMIFIAVNSVFEEGFVLGYVFQVLEERNVKTAVFASAGIRAMYHIYQGVSGALAVFVLGLLFALIFLRTRHLGIPVVAHTAMNMILFMVSRGA